MKLTYFCERCLKDITVDDEYEEIESHYFHTKCYVEGLVGAITCSPYPAIAAVSGGVFSKLNGQSSNS